MKEERIVGPDPVEDPAGYQRALLDLLGGRDPMDVLTATPHLILDAVPQLDDATLNRRPEENEWSVAELLGHLFDAEIVYAFRWRLTLAQDGTHYPGYDQDAWTTLPHPPFKQMLDAYVALRAANLSLIEQTPLSERSKVGVHQERGPESFELAVQLIAGHDLAHLKQLEQTVAVVAGG